MIVPIYNVEKYLAKCLESLRTQTYGNLEVIMVDDGSKDGSAAIAKSFAQQDSRFIFIHKENGGLSSARNEGLKHATGDYVGFLDSDDWVLPKFVEALMGYFDEDTDIVVGKHAITNETATDVYAPYLPYPPCGKYSGEKKKERIVIPSIKGDVALMPVWKNLYRRSLISDTLFVSEREIYAEDMYFNILMYHKARSVYVAEEHNVMHLIVAGSLSQGYRKNRYAMMKNMHARVEPFVEEYYPKVLAQLKACYCGSLAGVILNVCKPSWKEAISNVSAIRSDPEAKEILFSQGGRRMYKRYIPIYIAARYLGTFFTVFVCKMMLYGEPIYRKFSRVKGEPVVLNN